LLEEGNQPAGVGGIVVPGGKLQMPVSEKFLLLLGSDGRLQPIDLLADLPGGGQDLLQAHGTSLMQLAEGKAHGSLSLHFFRSLTVHDTRFYPWDRPAR